MPIRYGGYDSSVDVVDDEQAVHYNVGGSVEASPGHEVRQCEQRDSWDSVG